MNRFSQITCAGLSACLLTACLQGGTPDGAVDSVEEALSSLSSSMAEQPTAAEKGVVLPAAISIYMEGTHRLETGDNRVILLESDSIDLDQFLDWHVRVHGISRPTVEAGGIVIKVLSVDKLQKPPEAANTSSPAIPYEPLPESSSSSIVTVSSQAASSSVAASAQAVSSSRTAGSSSISSVKAAAASSVISTQKTGASTGLEAKAEQMAKEKVDASTFVQVFCSRHTGFCVPIHKNWFYNSFGATN